MTLKKLSQAKFQLRPGAVPSWFSWTHTYPRKRKAPTYWESREASKALFEANEIAEPEERSNSEILEDEVDGSECENRDLIFFGF